MSPMPRRFSRVSAQTSPRRFARNVYAGEARSASQAAALADYVASVDAALTATPIEDFVTGRFRFPEGAIESGA